MLITGSKGYVARYLLNDLRGLRDCSVYEFDSDSWDNQDLYCGEWNELLSVLPPVDYVVHLGAITNSGHTGYDIFQANTLSAACIARNLDSETRLIFFSSCAAIRPATLYGWSKHLAEESVKDILDRRRYCILRPYNIYGGDESDKVNPSLVWKMKHWDDIDVYYDYVRDFIHVEDVCRAVASLMFLNWQPGVFDLGTGVPVTASELYKKIKGVPPKTMVPSPIEANSRLVAEKQNMLKGFGCSIPLFRSGVPSNPVEEIEVNGDF